MSKEEDNISIERCEHDQENPYSQISNALIRDNSISPNCRWLLIYLLSNRDKWKINFKQVQEHVKDFIGRNALYKVFNEAIKAGYMRREVIKVANLKQEIRIIISEKPKFKIIFRHPDSRCPENGDTENGDTKERTSTSSSLRSEEVKEEIYKEAPMSPISAEASTLCTIFLSKIKERNPKFKDPNILKWIRGFDLLLRIDERNYLDIKKLIEWASTHKWWKTACLSPEKLRKDFDRMFMEMEAEKESAVESTNRIYALYLKKKYPDKMSALSFDSKYVMNTSTSKEIPFNMPEERFQEAIVSLFGGQYV